MTLQPFRLPLNPAQFASALQKGQGRALVHSRQFGLDGNESAVLNACLHNQAYDPQCEGDRADWLLEFASADETTGHIVSELIDRLGESTDEFWDASLRCKLALRLAQRGHARARDILYGALRKWPNTADIIGEQEIIELDGAEGLLRVAEFHGSLIRQHLESSSDENPLLCFDETHGEGTGRQLLQSAATHSPLIAQYLDHLDARETATGEGYSGLSERIHKISAEDVIHEIETEDPEHNPFWFSTWGRRAPESELLTVFEAMLLQSDTGRLCKYLRVFQGRALSVFDRRLLHYSDHPEAAVREIANCALSNYRHADVRALAIQRLTAGTISRKELVLLKANYEMGDAGLIEPLMVPPDDREQLHQLTFDLADLYKSNQVPESRNAMLFVYETSPCSNCRHKAVAILAATRQLPGWVRDECNYDSSDEIRALANTARTVD